MAKDIILFVNAIRPATFTALHIYKQQTGRAFTPVVLVDTKIQSSITERNGQYYADRDVIVLSADFDSPAAIRSTLRPFMKRIFAVTSQYENSVNELKKLVPYLPYITLPTENSLEWATEKRLMRKMMEAYDESLVPKYREVTKISDRSVTEICNSMSFPLIVKPSGLEGSLLVSLATNETELRNLLEHTFTEIQDAYNKWIKRQKPAVLVEEFMDGDMYSVDAYISATGSFIHTPPVKVVTGRNIGFDDFFGYMRKTPSGLSDHEIKQAYDAVERACRAVCLRSVTAHVELMRTNSGWMIIELGPRIGGFRHEIYSNTYGINHIMNDILNRGGETPVIPAKTLKHTAYLNIYAREEGILASVSGIKAVQKLPSLISLKQCAQIGEETLFAKNNGDPVFEIFLGNKNEHELEQDIAMIERVLQLQTVPLQQHSLKDTRITHAVTA